MSATPTKRAVITISAIMALRMLGLFMIVPVFSLYASQLSGASAFLIGLSVGIYGLSQALCQIPFGALSDRWGRKPIILLGLLLFATGSLIAACAHNMTLMILGRLLQGTGAIGGTMLAMMADLTREEDRTTSMAIIGMTIGLSFAIAMVVGPFLMTWLTVSHLFFLAAIFAFIAIMILFCLTPTPATLRFHRDIEPDFFSFVALLRDKNLAKLNAGIFILHMIFTASFIVIPIALQQHLGFSTEQQWKIYVPTLILGFIVSLFCIGMAERKKQLAFYFLCGIAALLLAETCLFFAPQQPLTFICGLCLFFSGFSLLEAFLPSLISRTAPAAQKGTALGMYSCSQFLGIFTGGMIGGILYGKWGFSSVHLFCMIALSFWLILAYRTPTPQHVVTQLLRLSPASLRHLNEKLRDIPGIVEVTCITDDSLVYLKMKHETTQHPDFIRLKNELLTEQP